MDGLSKYRRALVAAIQSRWARAIGYSSLQTVSSFPTIISGRANATIARNWGGWPILLVCRSYRQTPTRGCPRSNHHQPPHATRTALKVPEIDAPRIGLKSPSWIMVDEWNLDHLATSPHVADSRAIGSLSPAFLKRVQTAAADRIRARRYRSIPR